MNSGFRHNGVYHKTSVDAAKTNYATIAQAGQKRTFEEFHEKQKGSTIPVLTSITNQSEFRRPEITDDLCLEPLKASDIRNIVRHENAETSKSTNLIPSPAPEPNPLLDLSHPAYGLPHQLVENLARLSIKSIYPWQSECLLKSGALRGQRNLVYTAPTGGGKSLVADILMLKKLIELPETKALLVLPYIALVQEKIRWLRQVVDGIHKIVNPNLYNQRSNFWHEQVDENIRVVGFFGGSKSTATWADMDIAVCTIEKANSLVNSAIDEFSVGKLGIVVMDELHMLDDDNRGYILELMATKLLSLEQNVQLIGMSATLNNAEVLAKWLDDAKFCISKYRPVPVEEYLVFDNAVYPAATSSVFYKTASQLNSQSQDQKHKHPSIQAKPEPFRVIEPSANKELKNALINAVVSLANETARAGYGALVFCSSRSGCERDAEIISRVLPRPHEIDSIVMNKRRDLLNDLRNTASGMDSILERTVPIGVAFHHAGLTSEERDLIASAYDQGILKVIVATCSLAAGINLPARRVILHGARMGADFIGPSMLRQMRGRAGRKGKDEIGETYLCCQKSDLEAVAELMEAGIPDVESCLTPGKRGLKRAILEVIVTKLATSDESIDDYMQKTLLSYSLAPEVLAEFVASTMQELIDSALITRLDDGSEYSAALLGQAVVASSLTPEDGLFVHRELSRAMEAFVLDSDMHVLYLFTPVQTSHGIVNWQTFRKEMDQLDEKSLRVLTFVGLKPAIINKLANGSVMKETTPAEVETGRIYRRFYAALQLRDLCNEMPIHAVARKYDLPRGIIQNLAQTCHGFAAGMIKFCERMGWGGLASILDHFSDRLKAGAKADLLSLAQITYIKSRTARIFWENGFKSVGALAAADVKEIVPILLQAQPRKLRLSPEQDQKYKEKLLAKAEIISLSANRIWEKQAAQEIYEEEE